MISFRNTLLIIALGTIGPLNSRTASLTTTKSVPQPQPAPIQIPAPQPVIQQPPVQPTTQPVPGRNTWTSSAGLVYVSTNKLPNRINHVLSHAKTDPTKPTHSVFSVPENKILDVVDEAWRKRGQPDKNFKPDTYIIDMGRIIGTKGETKIMIVVSTGKSDIITAYPVQ